MGKKEKAMAAVGRAAPAAPFNPGLAGLAARMGDVPVGPAPAAPGGRELAAAAKATGKPAPARAVVRMERAGRGGRTVTVVEKLGLRAAELETWLGELKRVLGCGGVVEGTALVLQGDTRERVGAWLEKRGVKKVTVA
jgi:translation initiation factor 1